MTVREQRRASSLVRLSEHLQLGDLENDRTDALASLYLLSLAFLPRKRVKDRSVSRVLRLGAASWAKVTYAADDGVDLCHSGDRWLISLLQHIAVKRASKVILFEHVSDFLKIFGIDTGGKSLKLLRERFNRVKGLRIKISFGRTREEAEADTTGKQSYLISSYHLPQRHQLNDKQLPLPFDLKGLPYGVELSEEYFQKLDDKSNLMLVPIEIMKAFRDVPLALDFSIWLIFRTTVRCKTSSIIPHDVLMELFKHSEKEADKKTIDRLQKYLKIIHRATNNRIRAYFEPVVDTTSKRTRGRPKHTYQLRVSPSEPVVFSGKNPLLNS